MTLQVLHRRIVRRGADLAAGRCIHLIREVREDGVSPRLAGAALPPQPWLELSSAEGVSLADPEALLVALGALSQA